MCWAAHKSFGRSLVNFEFKSNLNLCHNQIELEFQFYSLSSNSFIIYWDRVRARHEDTFTALGECLRYIFCSLSGLILISSAKEWTDTDWVEIKKKHELIVGLLGKHKRHFTPKFRRTPTVPRCHWPHTYKGFKAVAIPFRVSFLRDKLESSLYYSQISALGFVCEQ